LNILGRNGAKKDDYITQCVKYGLKDKERDKNAVYLEI
jgi:hypothetical protein